MLYFSMEQGDSINVDTIENGFTIEVRWEILCEKRTKEKKVDEKV